MNNVNIDKIKSLAREQGIKIKYICSQLGLCETYLSNVKNGKDRMTDERLYKIADILGTTYEYLTDQTENPLPQTADIIASASSIDESLVLKLMDKLNVTTADEREVLDTLLTLDKQDFSRCLEVVKLFLQK